MGAIKTAFDQAYRDFNTDGVAASELRDPPKAELRALGGVIEEVVGLLSLGFAEVDTLPDGAPGEGEPSVVVVIDDPDPENNGIRVWRDGDWEDFVELYAGIAVFMDPLVEEARAWAEGTDPGGPGTKSAKEYSEEAEDIAKAWVDGPAPDAGSSAREARDEAVEAAAGIADRITMNPGDYALDAFEDDNKQVYRYTAADGGEFLVGLEGSVQDNINAMKSGAVAKVARVYAPYTIPTALPAIFGFEGFGQSNETGANSQPALLTTKPSGIKALMFNGGTKARPTNAAVTMTSLVNLVSDDLAGDADINVGAVRGETPMTAAAYSIWGHYLREQGADAANAVEMFAHTAAVGGQSIGPLSTTYYSRFTTSVQEAFDLAAAASKSFGLGAIIYDGNEANQGNATAADYRVAMRNLYDTMVADVRGITGQAFDPIWIMPQKSWSMQTGTDPASVTLAQYAEQGDGMFISHPDYCTFIIDTTDTIHRKAVGNILSGYFHARCFRNVMIRGQDWRGLMLRSCWWQNGKGYAKFDVPVQPLVLDSDTLGAATQHGFKLTDATGDLPVTVAVVDGDTIEFTPGRARNGAVSLRVGMDYRPLKCTLVAGSGGTTLRDSDTETVRIDGADYLLANWALSCTQNFVILEA